jgi:restriction system protein
MSRKAKKEGQRAGDIIKVLLMLLSAGIWWYSSNWILGVVLMISSLIGGEIFGSFWTWKTIVDNKPTPKSTTVKKRGPSPTIAASDKKLSNEQLLAADIDTLSGIDFERIVELYYRDRGYPVERIGGSGDHGVDLIIQEEDGARIAIQCKRQKQDVGNAVVLKLDSGRRAHKCHVGRIVTTAYFTKAAEDAASRLRIELHNRAVTMDKLEAWRKKKIVNRS